MIEVDLKTLKDLASDAREAVWDQAKAKGRDPKIYLHWTAGSYNAKFKDYNINITGDGKIWVSSMDLSEIGNHTWLRNSGSIGIALCCAQGAGSTWLGDFPPTAAQIETLAQVIAVVADALWLTIDKTHVMTHGEAADNEDGLWVHKPYAWWNDGYHDGDTRGDLEYLGTPESPSYDPEDTQGRRGGDVLRGKANWYREEYKCGKD